MAKGRLIYAPDDFVAELDAIKLDLNIKKNSECLKILAKSSRLGRELNKIMRR